MQPFLKLFGVKDGNGISPLVSADYSTVRDLHVVVQRFFKTPTQDKRDSNSARCPPSSSGTTISVSSSKTNNEGECVIWHEQQEDSSHDKTDYSDVAITYNFFFIDNPTAHGHEYEDALPSSYTEVALNDMELTDFFPVNLVTLLRKKVGGSLCLW